MSNRLITINLAVWDGEKYLRHCLDSILRQSYDHHNIEINIWDNNSSDATRQIIEEYKSKFESSNFTIFNFQLSTSNIGMWPAQEKLLEKSSGQYIVGISVDIILDQNFIKESVEAMEKDPKIGALQAKIYQYNLESVSQHQESKIIDTTGFKIFRSRRLINIGHGEKDESQYENEGEIFAVEGAVPVFRRVALEDSRINSHFIDPDFFWYGDDIDLTWRMRMLGWKQWYSPKVIAYHDRHTTKGLSGNRRSFISMRREVPMFKRRLDWRNWTLTIIKNDFTSNFLRDLSHIIARQVQLWAYFIIFEPSMIIEIFKVGRLLPSVLKRRREIRRKTRVSPSEIHKWFYSL